MQYIHPESKRSFHQLHEESGTVARVRIEFGNRCSYHGLPEYIQLSKMLETYFHKSVIVQPRPQDFFNHFRVYVGETLIFDSYSRYPPAMEVVKCVEDALQEAVPAEIPHRRGIPFSYWNCPDHEGVLTDNQVFGTGSRGIRLPSSVSTTKTSSIPDRVSEVLEVSEGDTAEPPPPERPSLRPLSRLEQPLMKFINSREKADEDI